MELESEDENILVPIDFAGLASFRIPCFGPGRDSSGLSGN